MRRSRSHPCERTFATTSLDLQTPVASRYSFRSVCPAQCGRCVCTPTARRLCVSPHPHRAGPAPHTRRRLFMLCMHTPRAVRVRLTARVRARAHPELWASCRRRASTPRTVRGAVPCCSLRVPARAGEPTTRTVRGDGRRCTSHVPTRASVPAREGAWGQGGASRAQGGASRAREGRLGPGKGVYLSPTVP